MSEVYELKPDVLKIKGQDGNLYEMQYPSVGRMKEMQSELKACEASEAANLIEKYFEECGLPKELISKLQSKQFNELWTILLGGKKN